MIIRDRYIDPFTDFGFKWLFGTEENKELLIGFLNDLLELKDKIVDVEYRNLEKLGLNISDRRAIFDIFCTDTNNSNFIVELQRSKQKYFKDRSLYYTSFPIQEQSKKGDWDYELKKVYFIGILEFNMNEDTNHYLTKVKLCDVESKEVFYDKLTYYYLEMPKFTKNESELSNHLDYWLYMLNNISSLEELPKKFEEDKLLNRAFDISEFLALDKDRQFAYQQDLKTRLDYKNVMDYAKEMAKEEGLKEGIKQGIEQGIHKGLKQGIEQGINKGLKQGIDRGREEGIKQEKIEIAKNLLDILDVDTIALKTGLTVDEINSLINN